MARRHFQDLLKHQQPKMLAPFIALIILQVLAPLAHSRPDFCELAPEVGPCKALIPSFYFNKSDNSCKEFFYGGCRGNSNRFSDQSLCEDTCL
ncbi:kunitz-type serine protease inhibitor 2-like isoform X2 [Biomphalaria glabrata]|uniref:Kunitz-type serine protease inhibitor 2-like isoform X2 n=1 Tax=Biomphalaria glabrata TaxID=6526 RepID=A0A9W3A861_BIOGL|nr:kunitz-type serine protease inhibitor 2-like isoform X2 [Biomphalaria glabrata]